MTRSCVSNSADSNRRGSLAHSLRLVAGATAASTVRPQPLLARMPSASNGARPRFGFTTYTWGRNWDLPTMLENRQRAEVFGAELRTSLGDAQGVELELDADRRREVRQWFADSPVERLGLASGERMVATAQAAG